MGEWASTNIATFNKSKYFRIDPKLHKSKKFPLKNESDNFCMEIVSEGVLIRKL